MGQILDLMERYLISDNWKYRRLDDDSGFQLWVNCENGKIDFMSVADEEFGLLVLYSEVQFNIPEKFRPQAMELITRINARMRFGNFDMLLQNGRLWHRSVVCTKGTDIGEDVVKDAMNWSLRAADRYIPAFMRLLYANCSALEAFETIHPPETKPTAN